MATTGVKSHLYPTVNGKPNRTLSEKDEADNEASKDLLLHAAQEQLVHDVSSSAVLTGPAAEDDLVGEVEEPDDGADRGNWSGRFDFLMCLLGFSVGLGNVWRFPYLAYKNGGGAFLFPFIIMFIVVGFPLMFLELSFGQFAALGPAAIFDRICPLLNGLGYGMISVSTMVSFYYTVIIAWAFLYLFKSLTSELPWERCGSWATDNCYSHLEASECAQTNSSLYINHTCFNATMVEKLELSSNASTNASTRVAPAQDFFEREMLKISSGIDDIGSIRWEIVLCLLLTWSLTCLSLSRGTQSMGKVVYFTALFPYLVLSILFFRGITLDGCEKGIIYYLTPDFAKLKTAQTWVAAAVQIFFALSPAWGGLITLSSYNKFHNNCFKDALIVGVGNILTSFFAGLVIFAIVGYLAKELDMDVEKVVEQGPGLAFIVFPDVVTRLPLPPLWSFLFFFMLITLGMGSEFALLETVITAVQDTYPPFRQKKVFVVMAVCGLGFMGGVLVCTEAGMYILQLMDTYSASWAVFIMAVLECTIIGWIYGANTFIGNIEMMIGRRHVYWHRFFTAFWKYLTPSMLAFLLVFNWFDYKRMEYADKVYPVWAEIIGWFMAFIPIILITCMAIWKFYRSPSERTYKAKIKKLLHPSPHWGPAHKIPKYDLGDIENGKGKTVTNPGFAASGANPFETRI